jgi:hypothetical protein
MRSAFGALRSKSSTLWGCGRVFHSGGIVRGLTMYLKHELVAGIYCGFNCVRNEAPKGGRS